jgi:SAM-dependent methyltransferase
LNPVDLHPSASAESLQRDMAAALRANRLDPKGLYATAEQAELWREVSLRHAPIHRNAEFGHLYDRAFDYVAARLNPAQDFQLIGLGCGTGEKEERLYRRIGRRGMRFTALDISGELVEEAVNRLVAAGATHRRSLVCDLADVEGWAEWLNRETGSGPRVITFFGLVPNLTPSRLALILRALLRPSDLLLASVHLAPPRNDLHASMTAVLPQYNNQETLAWLAEALGTWNLAEKVGRPEMVIREREGIPALVAEARWNSGPGDAPLELFFSLRYTPEMFEELMRRERFPAKRLGLTSCGEEGIWLLGGET